MSTVQIKPDHRALDAYYERLQALKQELKVTTEGSTRRAFSALLDGTASVRKWLLAEEVTQQRKGHRIRLDGILYDPYNLPRGYWEAKDKADDLDTEILNKRAKDYPISNIIFEDTERAVLIQDGVKVEDILVEARDDLARLLTRFYNYDIEPFEVFEKAVDYFTTVIPDIGRGLREKIEQAHKDNKTFKDKFTEFIELCRTSLNPNLSAAAVDEMLIQHLLTERLIRKIFQADFTRRNVIANKVEEVIDALAQQYFDRNQFQAQLEPFYVAIEQAADRLATHDDKQHFINTVYEQFFQGYSVKVADTHGIVYTPQEIVDFMCAAVEEVLQDEFGKKLGQDGVTVLDPCTGTGNFIINLLHRVSPRYLRDFYEKHLFANEVMLMPYYIAALNIERAYYDLAGQYAPFEGLCFVDTLDLAKKKQMQFAFMTEKNTARVQRQQQADITVIIGNPPYNMGQVNENDNNKNRTYEVIDQRVRETYARDSQASLTTAVYDAYVKFFRWATDRLGDKDGIICYVTNNSFIDLKPFDGMRKHLMQDFHRIYHLDLHGNVRQNPKLSGTTHNVFGIQVGVGITVAVRNSKYQDHKLFYHRVPEFWRKEQKLDFLTWNVKEDGTWNSLNTIDWEELDPTERFVWLQSDYEREFQNNIPLGNKETRAENRSNTKAVFDSYSFGPMTGRDHIVYDWDKNVLAKRVEQFSQQYNAKIDRYIRENNQATLDELFNQDDEIKWSRNLKRHLQGQDYIDYNANNIRTVEKRPFTKQFLYYTDVVVDELGRFETFFPIPDTETENRVICCTSHSEIDFNTSITKNIPDVKIGGRLTQCYPFYVYDAPTPRPPPQSIGEGEQDPQPAAPSLTGEGEQGAAALKSPPDASGGDLEGGRKPTRTDLEGGSAASAGDLEGSQPYTRRENITDWALAQFRQHYGDERITKWDIFYYVYGLLHHPAYRERYADNLKRELPRVPFVPREVQTSTDEIYLVPTEGENVGMAYMPSAENPQTNGFWAFSRAGKKLAEIHLNYESYKRYDGLEWVTKAGVKPDFRVEKMRPRNKRTRTVAPTPGPSPKHQGGEQDKSPPNALGDLEGGYKVYDTLQYNDYLTITGIPEKAFGYRLGNRSALDWVIDQYQVKTDKRSGITSDPNGYSDDEQYIVQLVERVIQVSVDTVDIVEQLARLPFRE